MSERFWAKVDRRDPADCWEWRAYRGPKSGYGRVLYRGKVRQAHRVAYEIATGVAPERLCVCHRCDNPGCVNPAHLFLGTQQDNIRDMIQKGRSGAGKHERQVTHCPQGHEYTPKNTRVNGTSRQCRACDAARQRKRKEAACLTSMQI